MENFVVSARKYRPATFSSVVGQQHITSTLRNAIERGQLAHAYLFCGPRGVGKTTCARIFAKSINCLHPVGAEACNACESCRAFNENRSMNIHELDAASNNSVDDIRTLIDQVRILPQGGRYSVFIIDEVHMLSAAAFNAFLKTLEEPPAHAIFILATTEKHKIIPTILSRCQIYDFNRIRVEDAVGYLRHIAQQEGVTADEESLNLIAQKADGGMRDALSMFDKAVSFCGAQLDYRQVARTLNVLDYDTYFDVTELLLAGDYIGALKLFDTVLAKGFSGQTFMAGLSQHMRDLLVAKDAASLSLIELTGTLLERYRAQAGRCDTEFLFGAISLLTDADGRIRQSANQRLLVELGLMKIAGLGQKKKVADPQTYPLPDLTDASAPAAARTAQPAPASAPQTAAPTIAAGPAAQRPPQGPSAATEAPRPTATPDIRPAAEPSRPTTQPVVMPQPSGTVPASGTTAAPELPTAEKRPQPAATTAPAASPRERNASAASLIGGSSLSSLLHRARSGETVETPSDAESAAPAAGNVDPDSESKLTAARERIMAYIRSERPRFVAPFEGMRIAGHVLRLGVPSQSLQEELLRSKTEMLGRIAALAGVGGMLELEVEINEEIRAARPIKLEDRIRYMTEKNPLLAELRQALDLEPE